MDARTAAAEPLLRVEDLRIEFPYAGGMAPVVEDLSFEIGHEECVCMVGESGSGKSVSSLAVLGLVPPPGVITSGSISYQGRELLALSERELRRVRGAEIAMVFQDPAAALNPLFTVEKQISDVIRAHRRWDRATVRGKVVEALESVAFPDAQRRMHAYPHELSGGLRQRVVIAMALSCEPKLIIADEPTTNLDASIQAQVLALLQELKASRGFSMLFVTHDVSVARHVADRVLVMYAGEMVEIGATAAVLERPAHPYTIGLLASAPTGESHRARRLQGIPGGIPALGARRPGAPFYGRCSVALEGLCELERPGWTKLDDEHSVACHRFAPSR
jgi:oligopeptide/dipeptide ABC transporter ATP-binding protein